MLDGRVVIVTGAARGLGRSHCLELARQGASVVASDVPDGEGGALLDALVGEIEGAGGTAAAIAASVTDLGQVAQLVQGAIARFGRLDAVVNNAGILRDRVILSMSAEEFDAVVAVHLRGTWAMTKAAGEHWRGLAKAGRTPVARIVNTTSGTGLFGNPGQANYGAAKAGIANLTMASAMELRRYGVAVNAISPIARTRMTDQFESMAPPPPGSYDRYDPGHASVVVAWLCSQACGWLTGAVLRVDGSSVYRMIPWTIDRAVSYHGGGAIDPGSLDDELRAAFGIAPGGIPKELHGS